ncbi:MAG: phosphoglycolate phosphatase [Alphaproteobacteria bacterium]|nr:phosphoglycolate phosphatase [Alphaproteobacteria bacterium]
MPVEALIFDLDGTLVDTAPDLMLATNHALALAGREAISHAQLRAFVGHGALALIRRGLEATGGGVEEAEFKRLHRAFLSHYGDNIAVGSVVFPGLLPLLDKARASGMKLGVCTNKLEGLSHKLLAEIGLAGYFEAVVGGDTLPVMKPDPAPYHEVARRLGVAAENTLMFGDSETDIKTAKAAAVPVIAVSFGYTPEHVSAYGPTHVIDHYDEAWPIVAEIAGLA